MSKKVKSILVLVLCIVLVAAAVIFFVIYQNNKKNDDDASKSADAVKKNTVKYPTLTFIGHASLKIKTVEGKVIYIDPYYEPGDYREPADYVLVTHEHDDHNRINLCTPADGCKVIRWYDALKLGKYQTFKDGKITIEAVPSGGNEYHPVNSCVGYIVTVDGVSVYHAGDTSMDENKKLIAKKKIDYAFYPVDGQYNMGPDEAFQVANLIGAKYNIPFHYGDTDISKKIEDFSNVKGLLYIKPGETIDLNLKQ